MTNTLGNIKGQLILDVRQAINSYTAARQAHISTVTALHTGAGAMMQSAAAIALPAGAMVAGFVAAIDAAAEFERKLDYFSAVSGATQAEYDAIRLKALQLGADTIYSADQIADSFVELGKSGVEAQAIIDGIGEGVASLGAAADIPLDTAANIMMSAVATFQLGADRAVWVADQLAGAANASIIDVEDLGTSLKYVGGVAAGLNIPFDDVNTALAILGENGIKGSTAGTSLRQILLGLTGATPKATKALEELGIITEDGSNAFFDANGSAKSLSEVFQILGDATAHMSDEQRMATLRQIFAVRALPSLIALTREGADGFATMSEAIGRTTALDVASTRLDNLSGDLEILRGNIDTLMIESGSGFQEFARTVVQGITSMLQSFMDLDPGVQQTILTVLAISAALMLLVATFGFLAGGVMNMIALSIQLKDAMILMRLGAAAFGTAMGAQAGIMAAFRAGLAAMVPGLFAQTAATGAATGATRGFTAALMANPIGLIIGLIAGLVAALIWFFTSTELGRTIWANFMTFLQEAWANVSTWAVETWGQLTQFFSELWTNIVSFFTDAWNGILAVVNWIINIPTMIQTGWAMITTFFATLWTTITMGIVTFVTGVITWFQNLPSMILAFFTALPGMIGYALGFLLGTVVSWFLMIGNWLITNVPLIINNVITWFQQLPGRIAEFFVMIFTAVTTWMQQAWTAAVTWAQNIVNGIITFLVNLPFQVAAFFVQLYNNVRNWMTNAWNTAVQMAANLVRGVIQFIQDLPNRVRQFFTDVYNNVRNFMRDAWNAAVEMAQNIFNGIRDAINGLPGLVSGIFNNVVNAVKNMATRAFNAVRDFAAGLWEGFQDGLGIHSPSYIEHAMWAITGVLDDETQRMKKQVRTIQGLGNGISEVGTNLGFGFTDNFQRDLAETAAALRSVERMSATLPASLGVEGRNSLAIAGLSDGLSDLKKEVNYYIEVNNPEPEPASDSLPTSIRQAAYLVG